MEIVPARLKEKQCHPFCVIHVLSCLYRLWNRKDFHGIFYQQNVHRICISGRWCNDLSFLCSHYTHRAPYPVFCTVLSQNPLETLEEELIGVAGLHNVKYIQKNAEVAILIGNQDYRKKGFGSRYLILLEKYAFDMINLHRLYAFIYPENTVSRHLFEKHDYILEGVVREAAFWNGEYRDIMLYGKLK